MSRRNRSGRMPWAAFALLAGILLLAVSGYLSTELAGGAAPQEVLPLADGTETSGTFTTAHASMVEAVRHFLSLRDEPSQPIAFSHQIHIGEVGLDCEFCHTNVSVNAGAGIPSISACMLCHSEVGQGIPEVDALVEYYDNGLEPPWERVYGWQPEVHVRFKHEPHYNAGVMCQNCHGPVETMTVAERAVDHTMKFCVECHEQNQASIDCITCHY